MTREEAIEVIEQDIPCELDTDLIEALEMAIKALEQMPVTTTAGEGGVIYYPQVEGVTPTVIKQESMREFTEEETKAYSKALDKIYKPTGFNAFNELCEDAISRQAVLDLVVTNHRELNGINVVMYSPLCKDIKQLQPVTPQPKTGHWIVDRDDSRRWDKVRFYCSECGKWQTYGKTEYCPSCGARMIEPQESEDKE